MIYVYRVNVGLHGSNDKIFVKKDVIRCLVIKQGTKKYTLSPFPKEMNSFIEVPIVDCFTELKDAKREADKRADIVFASAVESLNKLKQEAIVFDKLELE